MQTIIGGPLDPQCSIPSCFHNDHHGLRRGVLRRLGDVPALLEWRATLTEGSEDLAQGHQQLYDRAARAERERSTAGDERL